jgi:hypothetical protein
LGKNRSLAQPAVERGRAEANRQAPEQLQPTIGTAASVEWNLEFVRAELRITLNFRKGRDMMSRSLQHRFKPFPENRLAGFIDA